MKVVILSIECLNCGGSNNFTIDLNTLKEQEELICHCGTSVGFVGKYEGS